MEISLQRFDEIKILSALLLYIANTIEQPPLILPTFIPMKPQVKLALIKTIHSIVWIFFNVVIFYLLFAVLTGKIDKWMWMGLASFAVEGIVLLLFRNTCPLTIIARRYSTSSKSNFDIFLPEWLAKYNKTIYSSLLGIIIVILIYRLVAD